MDQKQFTNIFIETMKNEEVKTFFTEHIVGPLQEKITKLNEKLKEREQKIERLETENKKKNELLTCMNDRIESLEQELRGKNFIIDGLPGNAGKSRYVHLTTRCEQPVGCG